MDSDQINNWIHGFLQQKKNVFLFQFFLMYSDSKVQKLKVVGFGEISTSAKYIASILKTMRLISDIEFICFSPDTVIRKLVLLPPWIRVQLHFSSILLNFHR